MTPLPEGLQVSARDAEAARRRAAMTDELRLRRDIRSASVAAAFATVPRHRFAPEATLEAAYSVDAAVITKRDEHGLASSSVSAPQIQAVMLEQADIRPGMRVLEVGSGGYNAALIAELVGEDGQVVTVDIDPDVVDRARGCLDAAGYQRVRVICADAEAGVPEHAPFDRIIVTAGAWDIPPSWREQLVDGGLLVVPLRLRGLTRSVVFARAGRRLVSRGYELCGFVAMQGAGAKQERLVLLQGEEVGLRIDGDHEVDAAGLRSALEIPRVERWSGVEVGGYESFNDLDLWLATVVSDFGLLAGSKKAIDAGVVAKSAALGAKTIIEGTTFAYRAPSRPRDDDRTLFEFGVYAHGPNAADLADRYVDLIRTWNDQHRDGPGAHIEVAPAGTPDTEFPEGRVIDKRHTRISISWPHARSR